ncbi:hypothetical protein [Salicibibacter halophilus]|uniref:hypothetical protein n=1 Tax=Salicibibacter halophilus TaxID=2502791 RepID=UPI001D057693|nr:hypothetical protein [Salicibibacter halophilus]
MPSLCPEAQVSNMAVQDYLPDASQGHMGIILHEPSYAFALDALEHEGRIRIGGSLERKEAGPLHHVDFRCSSFPIWAS